MLNNLKADIRRYAGLYGEKPSFAERVYLIFDQGVWAITVYRFSAWVHSLRVPVINLLLKIFAFILFKGVEIATGISLPASAKIGKGFYVGHFGGIVVHSNARIGENCSIGTGVVIGTRGLGKKGVPVIGNNVFMGVGAKILGGIRVGNNAKIGANAVVIEDVPENAAVIGVPGKVVKIGDRRLEKEFEHGYTR